MAQQTLTKTKPRFFYGWVIVIALAVNSGVNMLLGGINFGLFIKPMGEDLGISRATFGWAQTARQGVSAFTSPYLGKLIDRVGTRYLQVLSSLIVGGGLIVMSFVTSGWQMVVIFGLIGTMGLGGATNLMNSVPVAKWFVTKRGRAMALMTLGNPIGILIFAPLSAYIIETFGWRSAWTIMAIIGMAVIIPSSLLFIRRQPSDMGLEPDGGVPADDGKPKKPSKRRVHEDVSWTRSEAMHSPAFWKLLLVFSVMTLGQSTLGLHRIVIFVDRGVSAHLVSLAISVEAVAALGSMIVMGFLFERFEARVLGGISMLILMLSAVLYIVGESATHMFLAFGVFGLGIGGMVLLQNFIWADYYGRQNLGSIRGMVMPFTMIFSGIGPPMAGYVRDWTGSYNDAWWVGVCLMFLAFLLLTTTSRPKRKAVA